MPYLFPLPKGGYVRVEDDTPPEVVEQHLREQAPDLFPPPAAPVDARGDFRRGFDSTIPQTKALLGGTAALVGDTLGLEGLQKYGMDVYQRNMAESQKGAKESDDWTVAWQKAKEGDPGALVDALQYWSGYGAGQAAETVALAAVSGGVGGLANIAGKGAIKPLVTGALDRMVTKTLATKAAEEATAKLIENGAAKEAAEATVRSMAVKQATKKLSQEIGAGAALYANNATQELGSIYPDAIDPDTGKLRDNTSLAQVWGAGMAAAAVETASDWIGLDKVISFKGSAVPMRKALQDGVLQIASGTFREAATEGAQTAIERAGAGQSLTNPDAQRDYINSMLAGAVGGAQAGAIPGVQGVLAARNQKPAPPPTAPAPEQEEPPAGQLPYAPFVPRVAPDGSVITTPEQAAQFEQDQLRAKYAPQPADEQQEEPELDVDHEALLAALKGISPIPRNTAQKTTDVLAASDIAPGARMGIDQQKQADTEAQLARLGLPDLQGKQLDFGLGTATGNETPDLSVRPNFGFSSAEPGDQLPSMWAMQQGARRIAGEPEKSQLPVPIVPPARPKTDRVVTPDGDVLTPEEGEQYAQLKAAEQPTEQQQFERQYAPRPVNIPEQSVARPIIAEDVAATNIPYSGRDNWFNKNVVGKTQDELRQMVWANPKLQEGKRGEVIAQLLRTPLKAKRGTTRKTIGKIGQTPLESQGEPVAPGAAHTPDSLEQKARGLLGDDFVDKLKATGKFKIVSDPNAPTNARGRYMPNGEVHLLANNIPQGMTDSQLHGLLLHEIGVHALMAGKQDGSWQLIENDLQNLHKNGNKDVIAAHERAVKAGTPPEHLWEETAAYLVQHAPASSIARRIITWFKNALAKLGFRMTLQPQDLRAMAEAALRNAPETLGAAERSDVNEALAGKAADQTQTPEFKEWFGNSAVTKADGSPLRVYTGTSKDVDFKSFKVPKSGAWFTADPESASAYAKDNDSRNLVPDFDRRPWGYKEVNTASRVMPVFLSIQNVKRMTGKEYVDANIAHGGENYKRGNAGLFDALRAQGYDGVQIDEGDIARYVVLKSPTQIKSALGNTGAFSKKNPNILYSKAVDYDDVVTPEASTSTLDMIGQSYSRVTEAVMGQKRSDALEAAVARASDGVANTILGALPLHALADLVGKKIPAAFTFLELERRMRGAMQLANQEIEHVYHRMDTWRKNNPQLVSTFNDVVFKADEAHVDMTEPRKKYADAVYTLDKTKLKDVKSGEAWQAAKEKLEAYDAILPLYNKLGTEGRNMYAQQRMMYDRLYKDILAQIQGKVESALNADPDRNKEENKELATSIHRFFYQRLVESGALEGYAPHRREGDYILIYDKRMDDKGSPYTKRFVEFHKSNGARNRRIKELSESPSFIKESVETPIKLTTETFRNAPSGSFLSDLLRVLNKGNTDPGTTDQILRLAVEMMPETALAKNLQHRKGTAGYEQDAFKAFQETAIRLRKRALSLKFSADFADVRRSIAEQKRGQFSHDKVGTRYAEELEKRLKFAESPYLAPWSYIMRSAVYGWTLGANVSSALIDMAAIPMVFYPYLKARHPGQSVVSAFAEAHKVFFGSGNTHQVESYLTSGLDDNALTEAAKKAGLSGRDIHTVRAWYSMLNYDYGSATDPRVKRLETLAKRMMEMGQIQRLSRFDDADAMGEGMTLSKINSIQGILMQGSERIRREIGGIAAYNLALDRLEAEGKPITQEAMDKAAQDAVDFVEATSGGLSSISAPRLSQSNLGSVMFMYKRYGLTMLYHQFKMLQQMRDLDPETRSAARRQLGLTMAMSFLFAGARGMPMMGIAAVIYNMFKDDDDDDFKTMLDKTLGVGGSSGVINALLNTEVSSRISLTDMLWRDTPGNEDRSTANIAALIFGGPLYGTADRFKRGVDLIGKGYYERGFESMLPAAASNFAKGIRYAVEGTTTLKGDPITKDVNAFNVLTQMIGFAPADYTRAQERTTILEAGDKAMNDRKVKLLQELYVASKAADGEGIMDVMEDIQKFNKQYPYNPITGDTISRSRRQHARAQRDMIHGHLPETSRRGFWLDQLRAMGEDDAY